MEDETKYSNIDILYITNLLSLSRYFMSVYTHIWLSGWFNVQTFDIRYIDITTLKLFWRCIFCVNRDTEYYMIISKHLILPSLFNIIVVYAVFFFFYCQWLLTSIHILILRFTVYQLWITICSLSNSHFTVKLSLLYNLNKNVFHQSIVHIGLFIVHSLQ